MVRSGSRLNSWKTVESPACWAWTGWLNETWSAPSSTVPRRLVDAGEDLHERRLARTVLADQAQDLARVQVEAHVVEHAVADEALAQSADAEERLRVGHLVTVTPVTFFCR